MNPFAEIHPALILLVGALFVPLFRGAWRSAWTILLPVLALAAVSALPSPGEGAQWTGWTLLVALALYDLCAVLTPCGPLKQLVRCPAQ